MYFLSGHRSPRPACQATRHATGCGSCRFPGPARHCSSRTPNLRFLSPMAWRKMQPYSQGIGNALAKHVWAVYSSQTNGQDFGRMASCWSRPLTAALPQWILKTPCLRPTYISGCAMPGRSRRSKPPKVSAVCQRLRNSPSTEMQMMVPLTLRTPPSSVRISITRCCTRPPSAFLSPVPTVARSANWNMASPDLRRRCWPGLGICAARAPGAWRNAKTRF
ncbi:hypothetical protein BT67DRAFT_254467 [Trichocladium antarcticum]|uniref:Uncharacterized protein n=1 Tax=Trichocladium antarcticum TaxID=1450529 RepID=A0AAN6UMM7_9PEZI|nr:hypothetical protein BT67DRAFT_254467 [Trichocladium antarcticum]